MFFGFLRQLSFRELAGALSFAAERDRQLVIRNLGNEQQVRLQGILRLFQAGELKGPAGVTVRGGCDSAG
jgi:hypothetical protein